MARTKNGKPKKKSSRTKKPETSPNTFIALYMPWGGHLFNPPVTCRHAFKARDGGRWTDLGCCRRCEEKCQGYFRFTNKNPEEQRRWLKECGVRYQD